MGIIYPTAKLEPMAPRPTAGYLPIEPSALLKFFLYEHVHDRHFFA
jgi:hypothetical protein